MLMIITHHAQNINSMSFWCNLGYKTVFIKSIKPY